MLRVDSFDYSRIKKVDVVSLVVVKDEEILSKDSEDITDEDYFVAYRFVVYTDKDVLKYDIQEEKLRDLADRVRFSGKRFGFTRAFMQFLEDIISKSVSGFDSWTEICYPKEDGVYATDIEFATGEFVPELTGHLDMAIALFKYFSNKIPPHYYTKFG